ncbi:MAG: DUF2275 domain-containing protein, partial [Atopobium sp.]|nr:DUF2275 domain-containing protein [Atopobium sp.]
MDKLAKWVKSHKPHTAGLSIAIIAVIALAVAGITGVFSSKPADTASSETTLTKVTAEVPAHAKKTPVKIDVSADEKVTEESTPAIVRVQSTDERAKPVDFYHAVDSGKRTSTVEV